MRAAAAAAATAKAAAVGATVHTWQDSDTHVTISEPPAGFQFQLEVVARVDLPPDEVYSILVAPDNYKWVPTRGSQLRGEGTGGVPPCLSCGLSCPPLPRRHVARRWLGWAGLGCWSSNSAVCCVQELLGALPCRVFKSVKVGLGCRGMGGQGVGRGGAPCLPTRLGSAGGAGPVLQLHFAIGPGLSWPQHSMICRRSGTTIAFRNRPWAQLAPA